MFEKAEYLLLALVTVDVVEEFGAGLAPQQRKRHEKAFIVVHCRISATCGQKVSCWTRSLQRGEDR